MKNISVFTATTLNIAVLFLLFISTNVFAQTTPFIQWQTTLGGTNPDEASCIQQTNDGGYIIAGYSFSINGDITGHLGNSDYWVVKLNSTGVIQWQKSLGGSNYEEAHSIQQTSDGGYIVAGFSFSYDYEVTGHHSFSGSDDYWIVKLDAIGNIQWEKSFGGTSNDEAYAVQQTSDGGYIVAGFAYSSDGDVIGHHGPNGGLPDYWILKLNTIGDIQWQQSLGGSGDDEAYAVQQTSDGGYIVAGYSYSLDGNVTGNHGDDDYWIVKLSAGGSLQWQKSLGGVQKDHANSIQQTSDGGYIVAGWSHSIGGDITGHHGPINVADYWVVKLGIGGTILWQKSLGGTDIDEAYSIKQTPDGGYVIAGLSYSNDNDVTGNHGNADYWIVKLSSGGVIQWQKSLGGTGRDGANSVIRITGGGYVIAGYTESSDGDVTNFHGNRDYWVVKLVQCSCQ